MAQLIGLRTLVAPRSRVKHPRTSGWRSDALSERDRQSLGQTWTRDARRRLSSAAELRPGWLAAA